MLCLAILILSPCTRALAGDWPEFRGPTGQGHAKVDKLPLEWSATKNVAWKQPIPGRGWSSPIIQSGRVYLTTAVSEDGKGNQSLRALCLDATTGKPLWNTEVFVVKAADLQRTHTKNSHASPTPVVSGGRLYVHFGHQGTACLDLKGKVQWRNRELSYAPVHGNGGSPVLVDGLLVFSADGASDPEVIALDAKTGKVKWRTPRTGNTFKRFSFSTPLVIAVGGKNRIVSPGSDVAAAYDPATGKEVWRVRYRGYSVIPRPVYGHGMVFLATGYESPEVLAVRADGKGDVTKTHVKWRLRKGAPHTPSLLLVGQELYMVSDHGSATCVDAKTGKVHWSERLRGRGYSASPIHAGGKVYFLSEDGVGTVIQAGKKYERVAQNGLNERTLASYAVADDSLFIRTEKRLYRIGK
jgi:outer membrane protein assembly factor BamB